jgi:hypothetical protein
MPNVFSLSFNKIEVWPRFSVLSLKEAKSILTKIIFYKIFFFQIIIITAISKTLYI